MFREISNHLQRSYPEACNENQAQPQEKIWQEKKASDKVLGETPEFKGLLHVETRALH